MPRVPRKLATGLAAVLLTLTVTTIARAPVAQAVVANRLNNGEFTDIHGSDPYEAHEWTETNLGDPPLELPTAQVPARYVPDGDPGSIWTNGASYPVGHGDYSAVIYPDWDTEFAATPPVLTQEVPAAYLAGRNPTISGYWTRTVGSALGIRVTLKYATTSGTGSSEIGVWNISDCTHTDSTNSGWESFSFSCSSTLPAEKIWEAHLVIEPTGTFASGHAIRVDALSVETEDAQSFSSSWTTLSSSAFNPIPGTADLIGTSTRYSSQDPSIANGVFRELYAMTSDGTGATRLTTTGHGYGPNTVNPIDHSQVAAVRFTVDWKGDDSYSILTDPARVYVLDLDEDKEIPITPVYWSSGLGGVEWTTDGRYIVFGVNPGRHWEIWKADTENNFALSKVTNDTDACVESDVNVANFSRWIAYRKAAKVNGNCYAVDTKGELIVVHLDDHDTQTTVYTPSASGLSQDGLPYGAYDPGFTADDSKLIFSDSVPDDGDPDSFDTYETATIPVTGGTPTTLFGFPAIQDLEDDWTWALTPTVHWNPSEDDTTEGIVFDIEHDGDTGEYSYWGLSTFDPNDGSDYTRQESVTPVGAGLGYPHFIIGGHHDPTADVAPGGFATGFDVNPTYTYVRDGQFAGAFNAPNETHVFYDFGVEKSVPSGATIDGIRVRLDGALVDDTAGLPFVRAALSWDDGTTWTTTDDSGLWTTTSGNLFVGGTDDTWGRTWSPSEMDDLRVRLEFRCVTSCAGRDWFLDNVDVRVFWQQ